MNTIAKTEKILVSEKYIQTTACIIKLFHTFAHPSFVHI